jgi:hypothetical protein
MNSGLVRNGDGSESEMILHSAPCTWNAFILKIRKACRPAG